MSQNAWKFGFFGVVVLCALLLGALIKSGAKGAPPSAEMTASSTVPISAFETAAATSTTGSSSDLTKQTATTNAPVQEKTKYYSSTNKLNYVSDLSDLYDSFQTKCLAQYQAGIQAEQDGQPVFAQSDFMLAHQTCYTTWSLATDLGTANTGLVPQSFLDGANYLARAGAFLNIAAGDYVNKDVQGAGQAGINGQNAAAQAGVTLSQMKAAVY